MRKIFLIIVLILFGINVVSPIQVFAVESCSFEDYQYLEKIYADLSIINYRDMLGEAGDADDGAIEGTNGLIVNLKALEVLEKDYDLDKVYELVNEAYSNGFVRIYGNSGLLNKLRIRHYGNEGNSCYELEQLIGSVTEETKEHHGTFFVAWSEISNLLNSVAKIPNCVTETPTTTCTTNEEKFKELSGVAEITFGGFCDYLKSHTGIGNFISKALNIVAYTALTLGVILGILDFIKAIASHDDAALTKAAQQFFKRIAAIVLIFLSGLIVRMVINLVPIIGLDRNNVICEQLELGMSINKTAS